MYTNWVVLERSWWSRSFLRTCYFNFFWSTKLCRDRELDGFKVPSAQPITFGLCSKPPVHDNSVQIATYISESGKEEPASDPEEYLKYKVGEYGRRLWSEHLNEEKTIVLTDPIMELKMWNRCINIRKTNCHTAYCWRMSGVYRARVVNSYTERKWSTERVEDFNWEKKEGRVD